MVDSKRSGRCTLRGILLTVLLGAAGLGVISAQQPELSAGREGDAFIVSWPEAYTGWTLFGGTNLLDDGAGAWEAVPGSDTTNEVAMPLIAAPAVAYYALGWQGSGVTSSTNLFDPFTDGSRTEGGDPLDTDWWMSTTGNEALSVLGNELVWDPGTHNSHFLGHFHNPAETNPGGRQAMTEGEVITVSFDFRLSGILGGNTFANRLRVGLYDSDSSRAGADNHGVSSATFTTDNGYLAVFGVNNNTLGLYQKKDGTGDLAIQALGGFTEPVATGSAAGGALASGVVYHFELSITNVPGGAAMGFAVTGGNLSGWSLSGADTSGRVSPLVYDTVVIGCLDSPDLLGNWTLDNLLVVHTPSGPPAPRFDLSVVGGSGDGAYTFGTLVNIVADAAAPGQVFFSWTGDTATVTDVDVPSTTLVMPATDIEVVATYAPAFVLTVNAGSGDGAYAEGAVVSVSADTPAPGQLFDRWVGDTAYVADVFAADTTVSMPASAVAVTATYVAAPTFTLTVNNGSGDGTYWQGSVRPITADPAPSGHVFSAWTGDVATVANVNAASTTVTMPAGDVIVTATYEVFEGTPVVLPLEVVGPEGAIESVTVDLGSEGHTANKLWLLVNGLTYDNKGSVRANGGSWVNLANRGPGVTILEPDRSYGGIGGGYSTLHLLVDIPNFQDGLNTIDFRFNHREGGTVGYYVVKFNVRSGSTDLLPAGAFVEVDPTTWTPPLTGQEHILAGSNIWFNGQMYESDGTPIKTRCAECHTRTGMDLKYFNVSNRVIIEQVKKSGFTELEAQQVASYIRTLPFPAPAHARPWSPPFQPGPGIDSRPVGEWPAGAGLEWVLEKDEDMLPYLFGDGSQSAIDAACDVDGTMNLREMPVAVQFPDWKHWLPRQGIYDIFDRATFNSGKAYTGYQTLRNKLTTVGPLALANQGQLISSCEDWSEDVMDWLVGVGHPWVGSGPPIQNRMNKEVSADWAKFNFSLWHAVRHFELATEFDMLDKAVIERPGRAEPYQYPNNWFAVFAIAAHFGAEIRYHSCWPWEINHFPQENGTGNAGAFNCTADAQKTGFHLGVYWSSIWYQVQMVMNSGMRSGYAVEPIDWAYNHMHINLLAARTGIQEPLRYYQNLIKCMQQRNRTDVPIHYNCWSMRELSPWRYYGDYNAGNCHTAYLNTYQPDLYPRVVNGVLKNFLERSNRYQVADWPRTNEKALLDYNWYRLEAANLPVDPNSTYFGGVFALNGAYDTVESDAMAKICPRFLAAGVDPQLVSDLAEWSKQFWPSFDWDQWIIP